MTARPHRAAALAGLLLAAGIGVARADAVVTTEHVRAELVADVGAARPGSTITVGVNQQIIPRWHTYWQNSGDSGQATSIAWTLPAGATAGDILWPPPRRLDVGPVTNYGYESNVTLLTEINIPRGLKPGSVFPVTAAVDWLVCEEICIPEQATLTLDIPIAEAAAPSPHGGPLIETARQSLPVPIARSVNADIGADMLTLRTKADNLTQGRIAQAAFFPQDWGVIEHAAKQDWTIDGDTLTLRLKRVHEKMPERLRGVLVISDAAQASRAFAIDLPYGAPATAAAATPSIGFALALLWALLGGLILNLMPCVFPVLSIKVMSLLSHAGKSSARARSHGIAYTLGVLASFAALAGLLAALKGAGAQIGWGFQFQSPVFVLMLAYLMFVVGLSQSGLFVIGSSAGRLENFVAGREGYTGSFLSGVLAAVVATPCTAPFMGAAIAYALTQSAPLLFAVFFALGLGLALPYLVLSSYPRFLRLLPRPGAWMERVKQVLAFPMYGAAVWLLWVLGQQAGNDAVAAALGGMILIAFAGWLFSLTGSSGNSVRRFAATAAAISLLGAAAVGFGVQRLGSAVPSTQETAGAGFEPYSEGRLQALRAEGKPVFVNFTAAWCITCLVNEKVVLNQAVVKGAFADGDIVYLKGDWTRQDRTITAKLAEFNRNGVPLYIFYPAGSDSRPVVLPQILTPEIVLRETGRVRKAEASKP